MKTLDGKYLFNIFSLSSWLFFLCDRHDNHFAQKRFSSRINHVYFVEYYFIPFFFFYRLIFKFHATPYHLSCALCGMQGKYNDSNLLNLLFSMVVLYAYSVYSDLSTYLSILWKGQTFFAYRKAQHSFILAAPNYEYGIA